MKKVYTEPQIIHGLRNDDKQVFNHLFTELYPELQYFAERLTGNREEARDIVSNTFIKFWNLKGNFESLINIRAFLFITCRNACLDYLRKRKRDSQGEKSWANFQETETTTDGERLAIESGFMNAVYKEIQNLPNRCREVFILSYFQGMKADEVARELGISVSAVTTQRSIAIKYLRTILKEDDFLLLLILVGEVTAGAAAFA